MSPPPPPPPPPVEGGAPVAPSGPPPAAATLTNGVPKAASPAGDHNDQLMAAIRNGISLKPTKTKDCSTPGFIKRANGPLDANGSPEQHDDSSAHDKPNSIDEMKDALQAELRNTLKRKIKQQDQDDGTSRKNEDIERAIEHTRNEVQLKLNDPVPEVSETGPKVDNPLKLLVDMVDRERGVAAAVPTPAPASVPVSVVVKQRSPLPVQKAVTVTNNASSAAKVAQPVANGGATMFRKVSVGFQTPQVENGPDSKLNVATSPWKSTSPTAVKANPTQNGTYRTSTATSNGNSRSSVVVAAPTSNGSVFKSPVPSRTVSATPTSPSVAINAASKVNASQQVQNSSPVPNGSSGTAKVAGGLSVAPSGKGATYYNTLPRTFGASSKSTPAVATSPKAGSSATSPSATPPVFSSTMKISIGSFEDRHNPPTNGTGVPLVRNGAPTKIEPLSIEITSNGSAGSSTNGTPSSPSTPKELLSPQVRSGAASIRPSQIRTLTKAGSVVSHTDIVETPRPIVKLPVSLLEPVPVLTAAAATSPPPSSPRVVNPPAKERTPVFEKAKEPPKSPLHRWVESSSASGGTARKLLLSHGRPNFTIKRSNSRQGFDVDIPDSRVDTVKPVFRILTDLEKMESEQEQQEQAASVQHGTVSNGGQQQYVSFAKDLANAPNNYPDVAVVTKTVVRPNAPADPFLTTLKDIKIDIGEMKIVNAKN